MVEYVVADASFYCCCESDIKKRDFLISLLSKYDFFMGKIILGEIPPSLSECEEFTNSIFITDENFFELLRPLFSRSAEHENDGEYEAIGIAYHLNEHYNLKYLVLDDFIAYKWTKRNFIALSKKLTRTIGFVKTCCYIDKTLSPDRTLEILLEMKKTFEVYEVNTSEKKKRPCSLDKKIYDTILIPLIIQIQDDNKNGRI
jgi:hypothetical protein